eukprot:TRINITY_DN41936_c0_g1_i1.p1 TRINITY_DN41936_c0_g1~~TRINITY_DN41936_c0_g1_i1.p1  ORF type:complete len:760 (+),score=159.20 TRINITY_DN41936_c0_g1_i1:154-2433(+)
MAEVSDASTLHARQEAATAREEAPAAQQPEQCLLPTAVTVKSSQHDSPSTLRTSYSGGRGFCNSTIPIGRGRLRLQRFARRQASSSRPSSSHLLPVVRSPRNVVRTRRVSTVSTPHGENGLLAELPPPMPGSKARAPWWSGAFVREVTGNRLQDSAVDSVRDVTKNDDCGVDIRSGAAVVVVGCEPTVGDDAASASDANATDGGGDAPSIADVSVDVANVEKGTDAPGTMPMATLASAALLASRRAQTAPLMFREASLARPPTRQHSQQGGSRLRLPKARPRLLGKEVLNVKSSATVMQSICVNENKLSTLAEAADDGVAPSAGFNLQTDLAVSEPLSQQRWFRSLRQTCDNVESQSLQEELFSPASKFPFSHSHDVTDAQLDQVSRLARRYAKPMDDWKAFQASWRKSHDALMKRRHHESLKALSQAEEAERQRRAAIALAAAEAAANKAATDVSARTWQSTRKDSQSTHSALRSRRADERLRSRGHSVDAADSTATTGSGVSTGVGDGAADAGGVGAVGGSGSNVTDVGWKQTSNRGNSRSREPEVDSALKSSGLTGQSLAKPIQFGDAIALARQHHMCVEDVRNAIALFQRFDADHDNVISLAEFMDLARHVCNVPPGEDPPSHLVQKYVSADSDKSGSVNFEEFLLWTVNTAYSEEVLVANPKERQLRRLARDYGVGLLDVERIKVVFDRFDEDKSNEIDEHEFKKVLFVLMHVKDPSHVSPQKLQRYWREVDLDGSGSISFEEFMVWYYNMFDG